jgi:HEAT repeat protein
MALLMKRTSLIVLMAFSMAAAPLFAAKTTDEYVAALKSGTETEQVDAAKALGMAKAKAAVPDLIAALGAESTMVQAAAAAALGAIAEKGESTAAVLKLAQETDNGVVRYAALAALLELVEDDKKADIQELMAAQEDSDDDLLSDLAVKLNEKLQK